MKKLFLSVLALLCALLPSACSGYAYGYTETRLESNSGLDPALDFGGRTVVILTSSASVTAGELSAADDASEALNDAVLTRNRDVELELGVSLREEKTASVATALRADAAAGGGAYDLAFGLVGDDLGLLADNALRNLNNIPQLDLTSDCWNDSLCGAAQVCGRLYFAVGALSLSMTRGCFVTFADPAVLGTGLTDRLVALVEDGDFTIDRQGEIAAAAYADLNENAVRDAGDRFGLGTNRAGCVDAYWGAFALSLTGREPDGALTVSDGSARIVAAYEKIYALINGNAGTFVCDGAEGLFELSDLFSAGQVAMATLELSRAERGAFSEQTLILPLPKLDGEQAEYHSFPGGVFSVAMIPRGASDPACCGAVLQALCARSQRDVLPAYYEDITAGRYSSDARTGDCLRLALGSVRTDTAWIYAGQLGDTVAGILGPQLEGGAVSNAAACSLCVKALTRLLPDFNALFRGLTY